MHLRQVAPLLVLGVCLAMLSAPASALAHERRVIGGGKYDVVVGWDTEPAFVNQRNAAGVRISKAGTNPAQPVLGAEKTLQLQIRQGSQTRQLQLRAMFDQPGYYVADIVPTRAGDYVFTLTGSIGTDAVNEAFDSADGKFDAVTASSGIEFPVSAPDPDQISAELQAANALAQRALLVGYVGAGLGVLGCLIALGVWLFRPRSRSGVLSSRDAAVRRAPGAGL
ncbi:MAG: hypothetical protein JO020_31505 [Chloroflexi bacterium]|nr:hypothetical protein [Chloroflexota bacterium]